jgi:hypothetical protein
MTTVGTIRSLLFALAVALAAATSDIQAQTAHVGVHYSALAMEYPDQTRSGVGAFVVVNPMPWLGIDTSTSVFFDEPIGGTAWQLQAGPRLGTAWRDLAIFGRARPGFVRFSERIGKPDIPCILIFPPPEACLAPKTNFSLDIGGTLEVPVGAATRLRLDLGDTLIRYDRNDLETRWVHSLQFAAGVGWGW